MGLALVLCVLSESDPKNIIMLQTSKLLAFHQNSTNLAYSDFVQGNDRVFEMMFIIFKDILPHEEKSDHFH